MKEVYIVDALRTAVGNFGGTLAEIPAAKIAAPVIKEVLKRNNLEGSDVDEVILGNVLQAGQGQNCARQALIYSDIPQEKTAQTVNMVCGSGLRTVAAAAQAIKCEDADIVVAGGTENMSIAPYLLPQGQDRVQNGRR